MMQAPLRQFVVLFADDSAVWASSRDAALDQALQAEAVGRQVKLIRCGGRLLLEGPALRAALASRAGGPTSARGAVH